MSEHGQRASITLVFYTTRDTYIRWFHKETGEIDLDGSEVNGFFPIDGIWIMYIFYIEISLHFNIKFVTRSNIRIILR